ncbi:unnamed protein product [Gongylonema pulchrum]|uniref:FACT complex subunit n=1 Tax=Gongylonema pulchrum TaxID=637853 RepID=A0A183D064_9BILA|nr:unnamed protein product [Gongylonema pulchrum]
MLNEPLQAALARHCAGRAQKKLVWGQFWAAHQRFFKYLCISAKVQTCVKIAREAIKSGKCVVIGLQTTGESKTLEALDEAGGELTEFVSTAKAVLTSLIEKHFPTENTSSSADMYVDFDKMCNELEGRQTAKRKLEMPGSKSMPNMPAKRMKLDFVEEEKNETTDSSSSAEDSSHSSEEDEESTSDDDGEPSSGAIQGDENAWLRRLMDEAKSSEDDDEEEEKSTEKEEDGSEDEINPFMCDFSRGDPWAAKQQVVPDSPKKKKKKLTKKKKKPKPSRIDSAAMVAIIFLF